ncbi:MAG: glycosyltransferase family 2 protein [Bacteroidia bacterium]|nr:glycosyltransferase family 2 protein [Bacteroidia bacterium]
MKLYVCCVNLKLSIVIVNYNVKHFLEQCLKSVYQAIQNIEAEVFVVDNNSIDGSQDMVRSSFTDVKLIANSKNTGFSTANNQAIKESKGEYVLLLNPDTVVPENCFQALLEFAVKTPDLGGCGIPMYDGQGNYLPESKRGLPTPEVAFYKMIGLNKLFPKSKKFGKYHLGYLAPDQNHEVEILAGAFMLIRKNVLDKIGLLDETFFMYGEDIDLSYRITKAGWKNYYFAGSRIIHYKGESTKKLSTNYVKVFYKAMVIFAEKHYAGSNQKLFKLFINMAIYGRASLSLVSNLIQRFWMVTLESILLFGSLYLLKEYWEEHIKGITAYPKEMLTIHLPYYTLIWLLSMGFNGSYQAPFNFSKLIRSILMGTLIILMIYGLLPNHLHFSRGIILFGTLVVTAVLFSWRSLYHLLKYKTPDFSQKSNIKSVLIGSEKKWSELSEILSSYQKNYQQIGFISDKKSDSPHWLGTRKQLKEIIHIYGVNELIFSNETVSTKYTIQIMNELGPNINYFTIPSASNFVIGSQSKNSNGLYFGQQIELNLSRNEYRSQKRFFDIFTSLILILISPFLILFKKTRDKLTHSIAVLFGKKTWVGYASKSKDLPTIKPGVYTTDYQLKDKSSSFQKNLDLLYAKNYSVYTDLRIFLSC